MTAQGLAERYSADQARLVVIDYRRGLTDLADLPLPCSFASRPPRTEELMTELRELTIQRLQALDGPGAASGAAARLSSGVSIVLHRVHGQWLFGGTTGVATAHSPPLTHGRCAGA